MNVLTRRLANATLAGILAAIVPSLAVAAAPYDYTRSVAHTYNADGTLATSTAFPGDASLCVLTQLAYDGYGNVTQTTTSNCSGATGRAVIASRAASAAFTGTASQPIAVNGSPVNVAVADGLFPSTVQDALSHVETRTHDPRFATTLTATDANSLATTTVVDDFGRVLQVKYPDGTSVRSYYCVIVGTAADKAANSTGCATPGAPEAPALATQFVQTEPHNVSDVKMGAFERRYLDSLGRVIRIATESFDGPGQPSAVSGTIVVTDIVYDANGAKVIETQPYFLATGSTGATGGAGTNDVGATLTGYDALGRPLSVKTTDGNGSSAATVAIGGTGSFGYGAYGSRRVATTSFAYAGLMTTSTNDNGKLRKETRNARGEVILVADHDGAQLAFEYDAFGNVVNTRDALQNNLQAQFDAAGHKTQLNDPDKGLFVYCYDALGQLKAEQNAVMRGAGSATCPNNNDSGTTATAVANWRVFAYDKLGRQTERIETEYKTDWYFDAYAPDYVATCTAGIGRLCEIKTSTGLTRRLVYDTLGRELHDRTDVTSGPTFGTSLAYNTTNGRISSKTYPTGLTVAYTYSARGYLLDVHTKSAVTINPLPDAHGAVAAQGSLAVDDLLWKPLVVNAHGVPEQEWTSNAVVDTTTYDPETGRIAAISAGPSGSSSVMSHHYTWDGVNNLQSRIDDIGDGSGAVSETYQYDELNRLKAYTLAGPSMAALTRTVNLQYNALGMLLFKTDVGNYSYGANGAGAVRPHILQSVTSGTTISYTPDADGNITGASGGKYSALGYTSFDNVATSTGSGGAQYSWLYDENHARVRETRVSGGNTRTLWYLNPDNIGGLSFEREVDTSPATESNRHYLSAAGRTLGVLVTSGALPTLSATQFGPSTALTITANKLEFWHKDHLGSITATTDHLGGVTARYAYDPFGRRRFTGGAYDEVGSLVVDWDPAHNAGTARGFTGHEHLDDIGIVNMNGRLYDETTVVFVQADPNVTNPFNLQNYNRYSYVLNNPLNATDPSGFDPNNPDGDYGFTAFNDLLKAWFGGSSSGGSTSASGNSGNGNSNGGSPNAETRPPVPACGRFAAAMCHSTRRNELDINDPTAMINSPNPWVARAAPLQNLTGQQLAMIAVGIGSVAICTMPGGCAALGLATVASGEIGGGGSSVATAEAKAVSTTLKAEAMTEVHAGASAIKAPTGAEIKTEIKAEANAAPTIPGKGYHIETAAPKPVKAEDATKRWEEFLGPGNHTNIHPRTGVVDADRIVSEDGTRSIRYGAHEMNSSVNKHHYHEETWTHDPTQNVTNVDNTLVRVAKPQ